MGLALALAVLGPACGDGGAVPGPGAGSGGRSGTGGSGSGAGGAAAGIGGADAGATGAGGTGAGGAAGGGSGGGPGTGGTGAGGTLGSGGRGGTGAGGTGAGGARGTGGVTAAGGASGSGGKMLTLPATSLAVRFANAILAEWPDPRNISANTTFEYNNGIVLHGIERVYAGTRDRRYLDYIQRYMDYFVDASGTINRPAAHSFDTMQPAILLPLLFQETGADKYRLAANNMRAVYDTIPRNPEGGFWHKQTYPNQMWLDSIYMGQPFLARYGAAFGTCGAFCADTPASRSRCWRRTCATPRPASSTTRGIEASASWANPTTGRSAAVWGRALGWYAMALVDMLPDLPADHARRPACSTCCEASPAALSRTRPRTASGTRSSTRGPAPTTGRDVGQRHVRLRAEAGRRPRLHRRRYMAQATLAGRACRPR